MLRAWGEFVVGEIIKAVKEHMDKLSRVEPVLRYPVVPRVKDIDSALEKAFIRKKGKYKNPYDQMTDKVGVRFITLLSNDIKIISSAVKANKSWRFSLDRDFQAEKDRDPEVFGYQSVHFVVKAKEKLNFNGVEILSGTPCEIQVRTMLQHVYCELTHSTVYKPSVQASSEVKRYIARSMALLETTDELLLKAKSSISTATEPADQYTANLRNLYRRLTSVEPAPNSKLEQLIVDLYRKDLKEDLSDLSDFYGKDRPNLVPLIKGNAENNVFFKVAPVLILYFLIKSRHRYVKSTWSIDSARPELESIFTDLGISYTTD